MVTKVDRMNFQEEDLEKAKMLLPSEWNENMKNYIPKETTKNTERP